MTTKSEACGGEDGGGECVFFAFVLIHQPTFDKLDKKCFLLFCNFDPGTNCDHTPGIGKHL